MNALDVLREGLGVREWAASITPSAYGEKVQREMPEAFDALRRVEAVIEAAREMVHPTGDALAALDELVAERDALKDEAKGMQIVADHFKAERDHWRQLAHDMGDALGYVQDDWRDRVGIQHPSALLARLANSTRSRA